MTTVFGGRCLKILNTFLGQKITTVCGGRLYLKILNTLLGQETTTVCVEADDDG